MKTAIYIDQGTTQLVLTPENEWEKGVVESVHKGGSSVKIMKGSFYEVLGGWIRNGPVEESLIFRITPENEIPTA